MKEGSGELQKRSKLAPPLCRPLKRSMIIQAKPNQTKAFSRAGSRKGGVFFSEFGVSFMEKAPEDPKIEKIQDFRLGLKFSSENETFNRE